MLFGDVARMTEGFSGSDLGALVNAAARVPLRELIEREESGEAVELDGVPSTLRPLEVRDFERALRDVKRTGERAAQYRLEDDRRRASLLPEEGRSGFDGMAEPDVAQALQSLTLLLQQRNPPPTRG